MGWSKRSSRLTSVTFAIATVLSGPIALAQQIMPARCAYGAPHAEAPAEMAEFSFLIGDFTVTLHGWRDDAWTPPRPGAPARWNGRYGLEGMAIVDEWFDPDPGFESGASRGINVRIYDPDEAEWKMMWIATATKVVQDLRARLQDGHLTMWQVSPERPDFQAVFERIDDDHWVRIQYQLNEAGDWLPRVKLAATRIPCT